MWLESHICLEWLKLSLRTEIRVRLRALEAENHLWKCGGGKGVNSRAIYLTVIFALATTHIITLPVASALFPNHT